MKTPNSPDKNENASGGAEASKLNHHTANIANKVDSRHDFKRLILSSTTQEIVGGLAAMSAAAAANEVMLNYDPDALPDLLMHPVVPAMHYQLLTSEDLCNAPPMSWMVRGVLPAEGLAALFGASGSGKSFLILDMGCAVAGGDAAWFGRRITQAPVTYVCLEGEAGMGKRIKAWSLHHGKPPPDALSFITQPFDLLSGDVVNLAMVVIAAGGAGGMVIIDTFNRAAPGTDENSSMDMGKLIAAAKRLQRLLGGLVLLVHHTGKDVKKGMRGHSSLYAALDSAVEVTKNDSRHAWSIAKSKDDVTGDGHPFMLGAVPVGNDDEGLEITSCVVVPDVATQAIQKKIPTLGSNQRIAHDALKELLSKSVDIDKDGVPQGRPCTSFEKALEIVAPLIPAEAKHKRQRAKDAITGLVGKSVMGRKGDWLWNN